MMQARVVMVNLDDEQALLSGNGHKLAGLLIQPGDALRRLYGPAKVTCEP